MPTYNTCQYCSTELQHVKRGQYSEIDYIWECPNCKANVTAYSDEPTGLAAEVDIRKLRHTLYNCKERHPWFLQYLVVNASSSITKIPDADLLPLYEFYKETAREMKELFKEDFDRLTEERQKIQEAENIYHENFGNLNLLIEEAIYKKLPETVQTRLDKLEDKAIQKELNYAYFKLKDEPDYNPESLLEEAQQKRRRQKILNVAYQPFFIAEI